MEVWAKKVEITADEAVAAAAAGAIQQIRSVLRERGRDHGGVSRRQQRLRWADSIHGMMAEMAVAKYLGVTWTPGAQAVKRGDVAEAIEVRATEHENGHLLVYDSDSDAAPFVLAVGHFPCFYLAGWLYGADCEQQRYWQRDKDPPCYWVQQNHLMDVQVLKDEKG